MRFASIVSSWRVAAENVFALRYNFQMVWVEAQESSAQMVNLQARRNWANRQHVSNAVNSAYFAVPLAVSIPVAECCPRPSPARREVCEFSVLIAFSEDAIAGFPKLGWEGKVGGLHGNPNFL